MTAHTVHLPTAPAHRSFRLTPREVRSERHPDVVLAASDAEALLVAARAQDVSSGGCYSPGPAGIQVWDGPWNGTGGRVGTAQHLGSVDWSWDVPSAGLVTLYRVLLTTHGAKTGLTTHALLDRVLSLTASSQGHGPLPAPRTSLESRDSSLR